MDETMIPKIRFCGFEEPWAFRSFCSTFDLLKSNSLSRDYLNYDKGILRNVHYGDILTKYNEVLDANRDEIPYITDEEIASKYKQHCLSEGDIIIADTAEDTTTGKCVEIRNIEHASVVAGLHTMPCRPKKEFSKGYLGYYLNSDFFHSQLLPIMQGTKVVSISRSGIAEMLVRFPEALNEQAKIGDFFDQLVEMITNKHHEIEKLETVKMACLEQMFPRVGESIPQLRFKGFEGDWERKTLNDCLDISKDRNVDNRYGINDVLSVSDDFGVVNQIELLGRSYAGKSVSNYGILKHGEIVYTKSPLKSKPFGIVKYNDGPDGIVSVLYAVYIAKPGISARFIHYYFDPSWRLNNYLRPLISKGAKNTMNISDEMALTGQILIPKDIKEQDRIASFFYHLDELIAAKRQEIEKLQNIKQSLLDKMFV